MNSIREQQQAAADKVRVVLAEPLAGDIALHGSIEDFDPWEIFPCVYGSYSSAFDDMALEVLDNLEKAANRDYDNDVPETLAHEMFREMLCVADLCDYGTSPRVCFATEPFKAILPELITKWRAYYELMWETP